MGGEHVGIDTNNRRQVAAHGMAAFNSNTEQLTGGPWEGNTQALTRTTEDKWRPIGGENAAFNTKTNRRTDGPWESPRGTQALTPPKAQLVAASEAGRGAGAATAAAATKTAAAGGVRRVNPKTSRGGSLCGSAERAELVWASLCLRS